MPREKRVSNKTWAPESNAVEQQSRLMREELLGLHDG